MTRPLTEEPNAASAAIDALSTREIVALINHEDAGVAGAVERELDAIARAVDAIVDRIRRGGRLIYIGAGTSGRLGVLDASECPPTYSTPPELVIGRIAGGDVALRKSIEGAEDHPEQGAQEIAALEVNAADVVVGLAASGATPYVIGALREARARGAFLVSIACSSPSPIGALADVAIAPLVGPEVITGSTRMKAGSAQKMVLNMLSTSTMIRLGKTYGNLMVDLRATNTKLRQRAARIVSEVCAIDPDAARALLVSCDHEVKTALVVHLRGCSPEVARERLRSAGGVVRRALLDGSADESAPPVG
jgi:N-acetylmuramic acid 6-phosphate etherase